MELKTDSLEGLSKLRKKVEKIRKTLDSEEGNMKTTKETIAKEFVDLHKSFDVELAGGLINIYHKLVGGKYGELRRTGFDNEVQVEIGSHESKTGNPILFEFTLGTE